MMPSPSPLQSYAGGGAIKKGLKAATRAAPSPQELDPLSAIIAARMAGQLEAIPQALPELSPLQRMNLPAAYAGDQRSLQAVQRGINEAETGLASPGRRKFVKQAAATAARSAIPDSVSSALGTTALKKALTDAVTPLAIPDESIQAAYAAAFGRALKNKTINELYGHGVELSGFLGDPDFYLGSIGFTPKQLNSVRKTLESLTPAELSRSTGLPEEAIQQYLRKSEIDPKQLLEDWLSEPEINGAFFDSTSKHQFYDYIHELPPETLDEYVKKIPPGLSDEDEIMEGLIDGAYDTVGQYQQSKALGPYQKFFGPDHYEKLRRTPGIPDPTNLYQERIEALEDNDLYQNYIDEIIGELRSRYKP